MPSAYIKPGVIGNYVRHLQATTSEELQEGLNANASRGYRYVKLNPLFAVSQGGYWSAPKGTRVNSFALVMEPCEPGFLYRISLLRRDRHSRPGPAGNMDDALQELAEGEAWAGYTLVDTISLDCFGIDKPGPGTAGLLCVFESRPGSSVAFDAWSLKTQKLSDALEVECPALGCTVRVPRMRRDGGNLDKNSEELQEYLCPIHRIFISPSTYEYENRFQSILWHDETDVRDITLLDTLSGGKRTWQRMGRERDEDSLTWNVFRTLDLEGVLPGILHELVPPTSGLRSDGRHNLVFWSVDLQRQVVWEPLRRAREVLGEKAASEPDLIVVRDWDILLLAVKFASPAKTTVDKFPTYYSEQPRWGEVFGNASPADVIDTWGYELTRYHLLAAAIQKDLGRMCKVVSLVREAEKDQLRRAANSIPIKTNLAEPYVVITWDDIDKRIRGNGNRIRALQHYLKGKTSGYGANGMLTKLLTDGLGDTNWT